MDPIGFLFGNQFLAFALLASGAATWFVTAVCGPVTKTAIDARAVASGKLRSSPHVGRAVQVAVRPVREWNP
ncbi:hypothetical protein [Streptomyces sp. NPDC007083]|uniref:hypothetical protein n=1 Tax=Streptomyces sp. NPDC007083 TaxID=3156913 RepID=UPI0033F3AC80